MLHLDGRIYEHNEENMIRVTSSECAVQWWNTKVFARRRFWNILISSFQEVLCFHETNIAGGVVDVLHDGYDC